MTLVVGLDNLDRNKIQSSERVPGLEVVAMIGESRGRHQGPFNHLAVSPDGQTIASAGNDVIYLWETAIAQVESYLAGGGAAHFTSSLHPTAIACSPPAAASCASSTSENPGAAPVSPPQVHVAAISAIVVLKDGKTLITADRDGLVLLWDVTGRAGSKVRAAPFPERSRRLGSVARSKTLAVAELKEVHLVDLKDPDGPRQVLSEPEHKVTALAFSAPIARRSRPGQGTAARKSTFGT